MTSREAIIGFGLCVAGSMVLLMSCRPVDPQVPWDREPMVRELAGDLHRLQEFTFDLAAHEVLAWRVATHENGEHLEIALVWGRTTNDPATARWRSSRVPGAQAATTPGIEVSSIGSSGPPHPRSTRRRPGRNVACVSNVRARPDHT
jgi:hypothetical protein